MNPQRYHGVALTSNLISVLCLAALIGLGIYVNHENLLIESVSTNRFSALNVNQTGWNVGCTIVGTAVGLLLSVALASHDDLLTRNEILLQKGVLAMYVRPLSAWRGVQQMRRGQFPPVRTLLILATIVSTLSSAATVAIFGIHTMNLEIENPLASYPLAALNDDYFSSNADGMVFPLVPTVERPALDGFLYRDAYIRGLQASNSYYPYGYYKALWAPESGYIGDTIYPGLNTSGIGLNTTSYTQFSGLPSGFNLPATYTFNRLDAVVFGTKINVSCRNATSSYRVNVYHSLDILANVNIYTVTKPDFPNTSIVQDIQSDFPLLIRSVVTETNAEPLHTLIIPQWIDESAFIAECTYAGNEFQASITLSDRNSPIQVNDIVSQGPSIDANIKWILSNMTHEYISRGSGGGSLADGWISSDYNSDGQNNAVSADLLGTILSEMGEAYFSLLRQNIEIANMYREESEMYDNGSRVNMVITVLKLGGGAYGWLAVYAVQLTSALLGIFRTLRRKNILPWEVQDPVQLFQRSLQHSSIINETSRLRFGEQFEIFRDGNPVVLSKEQS
ncbi:hypothetical protein V1527DRAFT_454497 [Lipomyces starkeyi]